MSNNLTQTWQAAPQNLIIIESKYILWSAGVEKSLHKKWEQNNGE